MSDHSADETAIRQNVQTATDILNRGDAKTYAAQYAPDADRIDSFGRLSKGRENIEQAMREMLTGPLQGATFVPQIQSLRFLTPTMALLDTTAEVTPKQGPPLKVHGVFVLLKQDGQWLTTASRTWVPATVPA